MTKKLSFGVGRLMLCLCELVLGILLLINPEGFTKFIVIGAGVLLAVSGVVSVVNYIKAEPWQAAREQGMAKGLLMLLIGAVCCFKNQWVINLFAGLTFLYGVVMLLAGLVKVQWSLDMKRLGERNWYLTAISAVLTVIFAVLVLCDPFTTDIVLWTILGISLIVEAVVDAVAVWMARKWLKELAARYQQQQP